MKWKIALAIVAAVGTGFPAAAATITVTTTDPDVAQDGQCSLIEAVMNANADATIHADCAAGSGADVIELADSATYLLDQVLVNYSGPNGLPLVASEITVEGNGSTIERFPDASQFRLIAVTPVGVLELRDLTLQRGAAGDFWGGALYSRGTVGLTRTTVTENAAHAGGGLCNASGVMTLTDAVVSLNVAVGGGGGITSGAEDSDATLVIDATSVTQNEVLDGGGGAMWIFAEEPHTSSLEVMHSEITDNTAGRTTGGIRTQVAEVTIEDTTIDGNSGNWACGGLFLEGGTGEINRTTISNNTVVNTIDYGTGGGLCVGGSSTTISNSTISGNQVLGPSSGQGYSGRGGGISLIASAADTAVLVEDSTICDNTAETVGGGISVHREADDSAVELELRNTIVAENLEAGGGLLGNCVEEAGAVIVSADFNLADDGTCNLVGTDDLVVADAMLSPLADHGGPTWTHAPEAGSPAVDSGDDVMCQETDQRGAPRPLDGDGDGAAHCDRGAVESGVLMMDGFETGDTSRWSTSVP
jgi:hypothetical protein